MRRPAVAGADQNTAVPDFKSLYQNSLWVGKYTERERGVKKKSTGGSFIEK